MQWKLLKQLLQDEKGASGIVGAVVLVLAGTAIGYFVVATILNKIDRSGFTAAQNTTFTTVSSNADSSITMLAVLGIVVAASAILASLG